LTIDMSIGLNNRIDQVTPPDPRSQLAALPLSLPEGVVFDSLSNLFVARAQHVFKITPDGVVSTVATLPSSAGGFGIAIDDAGKLYVADSFLVQISKITPGGRWNGKPVSSVRARPRPAIVPIPRILT
jgi:hypothetical protein